MIKFIKLNLIIIYFLNGVVDFVIITDLFKVKNILINYLLIKTNLKNEFISHFFFKS